MNKLFTFLVLAFFTLSCGEASEAASEPAAKEETPIEQKLAVIDDVYDKNDIKVVRIKTLLDNLSSKYAEPIDSIAEYTYRAKSVLRDKGIDETCQSILEQMNKTVKMENTPYKDAITLYLLVRANQ